jgi:hypothetical protein
LKVWDFGWNIAITDWLKCFVHGRHYRGSTDFCQLESDFSFFARLECYILGGDPVVMFKLKKDRVFLLKELRSLVTSGLERSEDRRHSRKLRIMRKEVDKWITELKEPDVTPTTQS